MRGGSVPRLLVRESTDAPQLLRDQLIRSRLNPTRDAGIGRASGRRVVFEAAVLGRIVRRCDDDPVGAP